MSQKSNLILDVKNIAYRNFMIELKSKSNMDDEALKLNLAYNYQIILDSLSKFHKKYGADEIVVAFDSHTWRKDYTKNSKNCVTRKQYKDGRLKQFTENERQKIKEFSANISEFVDILKEHTSLIVLRENLLEADDLIAGYVQKFPNEKHIIVSNDNDFLQLMTNSNVNIADPDSGKFKTLEKFDNDAKYFMFQKCFRGDTGDNVQNAYPRLREDKIKKAYYGDKVLLENLMQNEFIVEYLEDGKLIKVNYKTKDLFNENILLMDLSAQPSDIRELMMLSIEDSMENRGKYDMVNFIRFLARNNMENIISDLEKYSPLLSGKNRKDYLKKFSERV